MSEEKSSMVRGSLPGEDRLNRFSGSWSKALVSRNVSLGSSKLAYNYAIAILKILRLFLWEANGQDHKEK
jgi:hypothetical protein